MLLEFPILWKLYICIFSKVFSIIRSWGICKLWKIICISKCWYNPKICNLCDPQQALRFLTHNHDIFFLMLPFEGNGRSPKSIFINPSITHIVISRISLCWSHVTRLTYLSAHSLSITRWGVKEVWNISPRPWCQS